MEEEWKKLKPPFEDYFISNQGRLKNKKGKEIKPYTHAVIKGNEKYIYPMVHINIRTKSKTARMFSSLANEVYKAFGNDGFPDGATVYHKDGDKFNCRIENLCVAKCYVMSPTKEQVGIYDAQVISCVKHIIKILKFNCYKNLIDIDNIMGESYLMIWKHLAQYKIGTSFYSFCKRYVKYAFLVEWKRKKKEREYVNYYNKRIKI